jgi:hypothetical protein
MLSVMIFNGYAANHYAECHGALPVLIRVYRGQHWREKQNKILKKKPEGNSNGDKPIRFMK